jgi:large subunit ribosomal protein L25
MEFIQIEVAERAERGRGAMGRLRRGGQIPAVLYGLQRRTLPLTIPATALEQFLRSGSHLVELSMGGQTRAAILREVQMDPVTDAILHVDFVRVDKDHEIEDDVHVVFRGVAKGASEGGVFHVNRDSLRVRCRPRDIPREIVLDISGLAVGDAIHVRDVAAPPGVVFVGSPDAVVCQVMVYREVVEAPAPAEGAPAEPERIGGRPETPETPE